MPGVRACKQAAAAGILLICLLALTAVSAGASASAFSRLHWRSIGPALSGGRIAAVAGSDRDPSLYYIGGAGGVFRSTNGGASWDAVFADQSVASIGAIAVADADPSDVWVGTGEGNPRADISYGEGVWRSRDGAKTWAHLGLDQTYSITKILLDPKRPDVALVAALGSPFADGTARGVYRTTDGGKTWHKTLYAGPSTGASDLAWDPSHPDVVFAGMWQFRRKPWTIASGGPASGLYRSRDGGVHWQRLAAHGLPAGLMGRIGVAVAPGHPRRVYAIIESRQGYVWRSDDGGDSWQRTHAGSIVVERPFYFSHLWVDPTDADHVYATSVELSESRDRGETFKPVDGAQNVDNHVMWFSRDGRRIIVGHDAGWALSLDRGKTWDWRLNVAIGQTYHIGYDLGNPYRVCGGFQDAETFCGPSNSLDQLGILNRDWFSLNASDGTWVWPDPVDPRLIWNSSYGGDLGIFDTSDNEQTNVSPYQHDYSTLAVASQPYRFGWEAPIAFSPQDGQIAYAGANVLFATSDRGQHWKAISPDLTLDDKAHQQVGGGPITVEASGAETYDTIFDIGPSAVEPGLIWVGTDDGLVQLTRDGGASWHNVSVKGIAPYGRVSTVEPSRVSGARAYAVVDRHLLGDRTPYIFRTDDYGATWRRITRGLRSDDYAHVVREDPKNPDVLYAGLEQGMWISFDRGAAWQSLQNALPTTSVRDIRVQPASDDLIAGTHGNSIFILDDLTPLQQFAQARRSPAFLFPPHPAYEFALSVPEQPGAGTQPVIGQFAGENPPYGAIISYYLSAAGKDAPAIEIVDENGGVVRHLHDREAMPNAPGVGRTAWNLTDDPPVRWKGTPTWNQGPDDGADVIPGRYQVRLRFGGATLVRDLDVLPDPRAPWTHQQYVERHRLLTALFAQLSNVDIALNELDGLRIQLAARRAQAVARGVTSRTLVARLEAVAARRAWVFASLTSNPQASQDSDFLADQLRERIQYAIAYLNYPLATGTGSYGPAYLGPPLPPQYEESRKVTALYAARMADVARFKAEVRTLDDALRRAGLLPVSLP